MSFNSGYDYLKWSADLKPTKDVFKYSLKPVHRGSSAAALIKDLRMDWSVTFAKDPCELTSTPALTLAAKDDKKKFNPLVINTEVYIDLTKDVKGSFKMAEGWTPSICYPRKYDIHTANSNFAAWASAGHLKFDYSTEAWEPSYIVSKAFPLDKVGTYSFKITPYTRGAQTKLTDSKYLATVNLTIHHPCKKAVVTWALTHKNVYEYTVGKSKDIEIAQQLAYSTISP